MEGNHCYPAGVNCSSEGLEPPIWEYELYVYGECSITGGFVYRGDTVLSLAGKYIYGDYCSGDIWALTYSEDGNHINEHLLVTNVSITSFGLDQNNEILFCDGDEGMIYKFSPEQLAGDLNSDGLINILDVVALVDMILTNQYDPNGDINLDGAVNVLDVVSMVNIILGT